MQVDHIGYAVSNIQRAIDGFEKLGFSFGKTIDDTARNVVLCFGVNGDTTVELVCPLERDRPSPVDSYLSSSQPSPYHICYVSDNLDDDLIRLKSSGFRVVVEPEPAVAFDGRNVVFLFNLGVGLLEIVESENRKG